MPGLAASEASHRIALGCLTILMDRLSDARVTDPGDVALVRGLISGVAAEQIANDPAGRRYADHTERGVRALLSAPGRPPDRHAG